MGVFGKRWGSCPIVFRKGSKEPGGERMVGDWVLGVKGGFFVGVGGKRSRARPTVSTYGQGGRRAEEGVLGVSVGFCGVCGRRSGARRTVFS